MTAKRQEFKKERVHSGYIMNPIRIKERQKRRCREEKCVVI